MIPSTKIITRERGAVPTLHAESREKLARRERQAAAQAQAEKDREAKRLIVAQQLRDMRKDQAWAPFLKQLMDRKESLLSRLSSMQFKDMAELARAQGQASEIEWVLNQLKGHEQLLDELRIVETKGT